MRKYLFIMFYCIELIAIGQNRYEYRYWFDRDEANCQTIISDNGILETNIDVTHLNKSIHSLHIQAKDTSNTWTSPISKTFVNLGVIDYTAMTLEYWFDRDSSSINQTSIADFIEIDVSQLSDGFHLLSYQIKDANNLCITSHQSPFLKVPQYLGENKLKFVCFIDGELYKSENISINDGLINLNLDVATIVPGLHNITVQFVTSSGIATTSYSAMFLKTPLSGSGIKRYEYWINDDIEHKTVKEVLPMQAPLSVISLFEVNEYPIRSSCFHFSIEDSIPVIYAKNDFNILFFDNNNNILTETKQYIDINVKEIIDTAKIEIISDGNTEVPGLAENEIQWYKFHAEEGEAIAIKSSHATTIQIFNPDGEEILSTCGYASISMNDCYASKTGTYYVAIHDVTSTQHKNIDIDLMLIDKFAVIEYTPNKSANTGIVDIWFKGNGYDNLTSVKLVNDDYVINADSLIYCKNVVVKAHFDFYERCVEINDYDIVLTFNENGDDSVITIPNGFKIETAIKGEIEVNVQTEQTTIYPYPIKVKLKNTGNVGYWGIPINIAYDNVHTFDRIDFMNFSLTFPNDKINSLAPPYVIVDNLLDMDIKGLYMPLVIPYIGPNEEYELILGARVKLHEAFNFYAWSGLPWSEEPAIYSTRAIASQTNLFSAKSLGNLGVNNSKLAIGIGATIGGIAITATYNRENMYASMGALPMGYDMDDFRMQYRGSPVSPSSIAENCLPGRLGNYSGLLFSMAECGNPKPEPNNIERLAPFDPNDISGYVAESGSYYIGRDVEKVTYMIEFENDSTIATAPAHRILLSDTLDTNVFDINSIVPLKVQIGDKTYDFTSSNNLNVATIDMRPEINAIAQVSMSVDKSGVLSWILESLDPMTVEPTTEAMSGILPINDASGSGMGFITFSINLKKGLDDGTEVANMANIIFDTNDPISTPYWINETDYVNPISRVDSLEIVNDSIINVKLAGFDERSGIWKYDLYYQPGSGSDWFLLAEGLTEPTFQCQVYEDVRYGFCAIATDMAGNKEVKTLEAEYAYLNGDITTSIETISFDNLNINDGVLYDLLGRRVLNPTPGIYIRNGKKILIK